MSDLLGVAPDDPLGSFETEAGGSSVAVGARSDPQNGVACREELRGHRSMEPVDLRFVRRWQPRNRGVGATRMGGRFVSGRM